MMAAEVAVLAATADSDLERLAEIVSATSPEDPTTLDEMPAPDEITMRGPLFGGMMTR
jgi:hypothetical protein